MIVIYPQDMVYAWNQHQESKLAESKVSAEKAVQFLTERSTSPFLIFLYLAVNTNWILSYSIEEAPLDTDLSCSIILKRLWMKFDLILNVLDIIR